MNGQVGGRRETGALQAEDLAACHAVAVGFFVHLDRRAYDALLDLVAEDGVWLRRGEQLAGRPAIRAALDARSPTLTTRHLVSNVRVEPDGPDAARVLLDILVFQHEQEGSGMPAGSRAVAGPSALLSSDDRLVRGVHDGTWRIARKSSEVVFRIGT